MKKTRLFLLLAGTATLLGACEGAKEQLGLTRTAPDEFAVIKRAPLEMPPDYSLRPPRPGTARPQETATDEQAKTAIFGGSKPQTTYKTAPTSAEAAFLEKAGGNYAQPNIRETVDRETAILEPNEKPVAEKLLGITGLGGNDEAPASVVDAKAEAQRIKHNKTEGKSVTDGETPVIEE